MPFIPTAPMKPAPLSKPPQLQELDTYCRELERQERSFKIKFGACLVAAVFCGSFLWALMVF
jgi:hypothetical protein